MVSLCITDVNSFCFICCILLQYVGVIPIPATLQLALFACQTKTASYSGCLCWWRTYSGHWRTSIQFSIHYVSGIWELCERPDESHSQSQRLKLWQSYASSCHLFPKWRPQEPTRVASDKDSGIQTGIHVVKTNNSVQWHVTLELLDTDLCAWICHKWSQPIGSVGKLSLSNGQCDLQPHCHCLRLRGGIRIIKLQANASILTAFLRIRLNWSLGQVKAAAKSFQLVMYIVNV
jgi:hypothetical protein